MRAAPGSPRYCTDLASLHSVLSTGIVDNVEHGIAYAGSGNSESIGYATVRCRGLFWVVVVMLSFVFVFTHCKRRQTGALSSKNEDLSGQVGGHDARTRGP